MSSAPTLKSIAQRVGTTANTVSLALRDSPLVAQATKARIQAAAREMGYVQNAIAGSLRSGRTNTIAVVMGDIANPLFAAKTKALERVLREEGYQIIIFNSDEDPGREAEAVRTAISRKVDGVVLCPCAEPEESLRLLKRHGVPCVLCGRMDRSGDEDTVLWNDWRGGYLAASHLLSCGCRRIAWLGVTQRISSARDRKNGYLDALREAGVEPDPALVAEASPTGGDVGRVLAPLLERGADAICAFSDLIAWEAACYLEDTGLRVPADIQLTGFDNVAAHMRIPYRLTSIGADLEREARESMRLLLLRMREPGRPVTISKIETELVVRSSTLPRGEKG